MRDVCPTHPELADYVLGKLSRERCEEIDMHLDQCVGCQAELETHGDADDTFLSRLRERESAEELLVDVECGELIDRVAAIIREPSLALQRQIAEATAGSTELGEIGPYRLLQTLGAGGMGTVYKAFHPKLKRVVALKMLPAERTQDQQAIQRFEREMEAVGKLDHPNIVRATDAGEHDGKHFLVMEHVAGVDLSELSRRRGPLPIADACELIRQAAVGLQHAHENGLVHRDIKPSNLMLTVPLLPPGKGRDEGHSIRLKILDLGLALLPQHLGEGSELTSSGQAMGTLDYMAPEQGGDSHDVDIRADIYALGATLYKLLTGQAIYAGPNYKTIMDKWRALATESAAPIQSRRPDVPDALAAVVHRMLARDVNDRYATPQEVAAALAPFCVGADLVALAERHGQLPAGDDSKSTTSLLKEAAALDTSLRPQKAADVADTRPHLTKPQAEIARPQNLLAAIGLGLVSIAALAALMVFYFQTPQGTLRVEIDDPEIEVKVKGEGIVLTHADKEPIKLKPGEHTLIVTRGDEFTFEAKQLILKKGEITTIKVELLPGKVQVVSAGDVIGQQQIGERPALAPKGNFALAFDGTNDYVEVPSLTYDGSPITIECFLAFSGELRGPKCAVGWYQAHLSADEKSRYHFGWFDSRNRGHILRTDSAVVPEMVHLAGVFDGRSFDIFLNGKLEARAPKSQLAEGPKGSDLPFLIGALSLPANRRHQFFHGVTSQIRITKGARYTQDFTPADRLEADTSTLALYHFDEGSGDVLHDASGNGHDGKIVGAKWVRVEPNVEPKDSAVRPSDPGALEELTAEQRKSLEWALSVGGTLALVVDEQESYYTANDPLPEVPFRVSRLFLSATGAVDGDSVENLKNLPLVSWTVNFGPPVDDETLGKLMTYPGIAETSNMTLERTLITDDGLVHLQKLAHPWIVSLSGTGVSAKGLAHLHNSTFRMLKLRDCKQISDEACHHLVALPALRWLDLEGTAITDAGLTELAQCKSLESLYVRRCEVSEAAVKQFAAACPKCHIVWDGGTIAGAKSAQGDETADPDRAAAEYVLSLGGKIRTDVEGFKDDELPDVPFKLTGAFLKGRQGVTDEGLSVFRGCRDLEYLDLCRTAVTDAGLAHFAGCDRLTSLALDGDKLNSGITEQGLAHFQNCTELTVLWLAGSGIDDAALKRFANCRKLRSVSLYQCPVTAAGIAALGPLAELESLNVSWTDVSDDVITQMKACPKLTALGIGWGVTDKGLAELPNLKALTHLGVYPTPGQVTAAGAAHLKDCQRLTKLGLMGPGITDNVLVAVGECTELESLGLNISVVTDAGLSHLKNCRKLRLLWGSSKGVSAKGIAALQQELPECDIRFGALGVESLNPLLPDISFEPDRAAAEYVLALGGKIQTDVEGSKWNERLPDVPFKLTGVNLYRCPGVTDEGLVVFRGCRNLEDLNLQWTEVTDAGLAHFADCDRLRSLALNECKFNRKQLTEQGLANFHDCLELTSLHLTGSAIDDAALKHFANCRKLKSVNVILTSVTEEGIAGLGAQPDLESLNLKWTGASDAVITQMKDCPKLTFLGLGGGVTDEGLAELPNLKALTSLALYPRPDNVTAAGAAHLKDCQRLTSLELTGSSISDDVLAEVGKCSQLESLGLYATTATDDGFRHLQNCPNLRRVWISPNQRISSQAVDALKQALPECDIHYSDKIDEESTDSPPAPTPFEEDGTKADVVGQ